VQWWWKVAARGFAFARATWSNLFIVPILKRKPSVTKCVQRENF
jgi:hypothetical protein